MKQYDLTDMKLTLKLTILEQVFRLKLCKLVLKTTCVILGQTRLLSISNKSCYFCPALNAQQTLFQ